jgi:leucyl aminopeptidase
MPIDIQVSAETPAGQSADVLVIGILQSSSAKAGTLPPALKPVDAALGGALAKLATRDEFTAKRDQMLSLSCPLEVGGLSADRLVVMGLGEKRSLTSADVRTFAAKAARAANAEKATTLAVLLPAGLDDDLRAVGEGIELGAYRFTKYLTGDRKPKAQLAKVLVVTHGKVDAKAKAAVALGQSVAAGVNLARDLSNEPPNVIYPESFASIATTVAKEHGLKVEVFDFDEIRRRGMKLIDAVGRGSAREPRLVHLTWSPRGAKRKLVFVGKGITFDSGGISIKPAAGMGEMKHDMSGAANVVGLMSALAAVKPKIEVHAIAGLAENMPDGNAYRPGDIWGSLDGKTVEMINTDAEGRLVLADALAYARTLSPELIVDNATLTGACVVALGNTCSGWYSNNDDAAAMFANAVKESGESMWRMPLLEDLREQLKSEVADVKQTGERYGGSITAALFLREFVGDSAWVHCDIAGPANVDRPIGWMQAKGATGHAVLTFLSLVEQAARAG